MPCKAGIFTELSLKIFAAFYTESVIQVKYCTIDISIPSMCKSVCLHIAMKYLKINESKLPSPACYNSVPYNDNRRIKTSKL